MFVFTDASIVLTKRGMHHQPNNLSKQSPCAVFMLVLTKRWMHHQPNNLWKQSPCAVFMFVLTDASVECTISSTTCRNSHPALFLCLFLLMQALFSLSVECTISPTTCQNSLPALFLCLFSLSVECTISPTTCRNSLPALFLCLSLLMQALFSLSVECTISPTTCRNGHLALFYVCFFWCKRGMHHQPNNLSKQSPCAVLNAPSAQQPVNSHPYCITLVVKVR